MRWFGGFSGPTGAPRTPVGGTRIRASTPECWTVGQWTGHEVRTTETGTRTVVVVGACGITSPDLDRLGVHGVPDDVVWRWPGSYVVVEITEAGTTVWTDLCGAWPVYTTAMYGGVFWASSSRALAGLARTTPDLDMVAARLLAPSVPALLDGRSAFTGVDLVPAGHRLTLPTSGRSVTRRVWTPQPLPGTQAARLRDELAAAVALRMAPASTPTVDLSGGYDSTALAMLASKSARPDQSVTGVTVYPVGRPTGGDLTFARAAAQRSGIVHRLMPLDAEHAPYSALDAVPITDEPAPSTIAHARFSSQLRWMREMFGSDCHMTGDGGDSLLCSPPIMLADLIAAGRYWRATTETAEWARLRRLAVWPLLTAAFRTARTSRAAALGELAVALRTGRSKSESDGDIRWYSTEPIPPWATPDAQARAAASAANLAGRVNPALSESFTTTVAVENMADVGRTARADVQLAEWTGVPLHNPFTDSRVVNAYLSVPLDARPGPAKYKPLLRDALADLFPAELATRTTKGDFNRDHYGGMRANLAALHEMTNGRLAELGLVEPAALRRTLSMTAAGLPVAFSTVEPAVATEVWLRALDRTTPVAWSVTTSDQQAS